MRSFLLSVREGGRLTRIVIFVGASFLIHMLWPSREDGYEFLLVAVEHFQEMHPSYKVPEGVGYIWMCGAPTQTCSDRLSSECDDWVSRHGIVCSVGNLNPLLT